MLYDIWHRESRCIKGAIRTSITLWITRMKSIWQKKRMWIIGSARISICAWIIKIKCVPSFYCRLTFHRKDFFQGQQEIKGEIKSDMLRCNGNKKLLITLSCHHCKFRLIIFVYTGTRCRPDWASGYIFTRLGSYRSTSAVHTTGSLGF